LQEPHIYRRAPGISHLLFADDTFLFLEAKEDHALLIREALRLYERCTGQLINPMKCSVMFEAHCTQDDQERFKDILSVCNTTTEEKYLGLPTPDGRMFKDKFKTIKERLVNKFSNWVERNMPSGAKVVMIKDVARAIPTYMMSVFKLPANLCDELTQLVRYFWWDEEAGNRKVHWITWDKLLWPKDRGGIGFRDLRLFNQALLARQP
jgi:hypothetical protein